jgi:hypothetical protein
MDNTMQPRDPDDDDDDDDVEDDDTNHDEDDEPAVIREPDERRSLVKVSIQSRATTHFASACAVPQTDRSSAWTG